MNRLKIDGKNRRDKGPELLPSAFQLLGKEKRPSAFSLEIGRAGLPQCRRRPEQLSGIEPLPCDLIQTVGQNSGGQISGKQ